MSGSRRKIVIPLLAVVLLVTIWQPGPAAEAEDCGRLLKDRCQDCHWKARICQGLKKNSKGDWKRIVQAMQNKGARLSDDERQQLTQCLSQKVPAVLAFCNDSIAK